MSLSPVHGGMRCLVCIRRHKGLCAGERADRESGVEEVDVHESMRSITESEYEGGILRECVLLLRY
jgi:hypothetical protein